MRRIEPSKIANPAGKSALPTDAGLLPEECAAFLRQIGSPEVFTEGLEEELVPTGVGTEAEMRAFLEAYHHRVLVPIEIPAITQARFHAAQGHVRELIALDLELSGKPIWPALASASRRIGRAQLKRLRPLRDERTVQRYLDAVQSGQATGWHSVVFGLTLAVFSWPLRHGLLTYGRETLSALASAARPATVSEAASVEILNPLILRLPDAIEKALAFSPAESDSISMSTKKPDSSLRSRPA